VKVPVTGINLTGIINKWHQINETSYKQSISGDKKKGFENSKMIIGKN